MSGWARLARKRLVPDLRETLPPEALVIWPQGPPQQNWWRQVFLNWPLR